MGFDPFIREPLFDKPRRTIIRADFEDASIGREFHNCRVSKISHSAPYKGQIDAYIRNIKKYESRGTGLLLHGDYGTGKTGTAVAVCVEAMIRSGRAHFLSVWDIEETFRNSIGWRERAQQCAKNMQFLVLDDVGVCTKKNQDSVDSAIAMIVRHRYNNQLPTFITTNLDMERLFTRYRSLQRIFVNKYFEVDVQGTDWVSGAEE